MKPKREEGRVLKGWSTKYALSTGIHPCRVSESVVNGTEYVYTVRGQVQLKKGLTFFEDLEAAKSNAREQAIRKLKGLDRSIKKMSERADTPKVCDKEELL